MRKIRLFALLAAVLALVAAACGGGEETTTTPASQTTAAATTAVATTAAAPEETMEPVRMAFIYDGQADDGGWNQAYDAARQYVEANMGDRVETTFVEEVSPGSETQAALEDFAEQGYDIVIGTTYIQDDLLDITPNYPDTIFLSWAGWQLDEDVGKRRPLRRRHRRRPLPGRLGRRQPARCGHDRLCCRLRHRRGGEGVSTSSPKPPGS